MGIKTSLCALLMTGALTFNLAAPAFCQPVEAGTAREAVRTEAAAGHREWKTDLRLALERERDLREASGMTLAEWDARTEAARKEGSASPLTKGTILDADRDTQILRKDGAVYYIQGNSAFAPVEDAQDACRTVYSLLSMLGGSRRIDLRLWSRLQENGRMIYSFQQIAGTETVPGSGVKLVVNADHSVSAVFSSLSSEHNERQTPVSQADAEEVVREYLQEKGTDTAILSEKTDRVIHTPVTMDMLTLEEPEEEEEEIIPDQVLWVVYTANEGTDQAAYPYLAHYVTLDGNYDYSLPVREPGDAEALDGFRKQPVFDNMEQGEWTGEVKDLDGDTQTITVPVMRSTETGEWYLGDLDRRIAVADYAAAAYSDSHGLELVGTADNEGWDNEDLFMYYNYIRAWDFYADMGWIGPDGQGTDVIILKDLCLPDGTPYENACSIGKVENWQMFGYTGYTEEVPGESKPLGLVQALDVMAHEYTHTFTTTVMNANLYENDLGAINEAMSDIMGNIAEYICGDTADTRWLVGENTGTAIRSMSNPARYGQPAFVWDCFYGPHTDSPNSINDNGGVHSNSSLLNRIAAGLCLEAGMSHEEAAAFWVTTACGLTAGTDYPQIGALLKWALEASGNGKYAPQLDALLAETRLDVTEIPDRIPYGQMLVKLPLPETEAFEDDHWALLSIQPNLRALEELGACAIGTVIDMFRDPDHTQVLYRTASDLTERLDLDRTKLDLDCLKGGDKESVLDGLGDILRYALGTIFTQNVSWRAADTNEIVAVMQKAPTLHVLMRLTDQGTKLDQLFVLFEGHWYDLGPLKDLTAEGEDGQPDYAGLIGAVSQVAMEYLSVRLSSNPADEAQDEESSFLNAGVVSDLICNAFELADYLTADVKPASLLNVFTTRAVPVCLPTAGLENVTLTEA